MNTAYGSSNDIEPKIYNVKDLMLDTGYICIRSHFICESNWTNLIRQNHNDVDQQTNLCFMIIETANLVISFSIGQCNNIIYHFGFSVCINYFLSLFMFVFIILILLFIYSVLFVFLFGWLIIPKIYRINKLSRTITKPNGSFLSFTEQ